MRGRKYEQIKNYSKIMKIKRETGEVEELPNPNHIQK